MISKSDTMKQDSVQILDKFLGYLRLKKPYYVTNIFKNRKIEKNISINSDKIFIKLDFKI